MLPKLLKRAIKRRLATAASAKFHGKPRARLCFYIGDKSAEIILDHTSLHLPQPFATTSIEWLKSHPEDVVELQVFLKLARQADGLLFDIGAHIGTFSVLFCKACPYDAVAFEPVPQSQVTIKQTTRLNLIPDLRIQVIGKALGSKVGVTEMQFDQATGFAQVQQGQLQASPKRIISAATTTIDTVRSTLEKKVALLKIDVEGFEDEVLLGSYRTLSEDRPIVSIEIHNACLVDRCVDLQRMLNGVAEQDYSLMRLNGRRITARSAATAFLPRSHLLAIPTEKFLFYQRLLT